MRGLAVIGAELRHRRVSAGLFVLVVATAVAVFDVHLLVTAAGRDETRIVQRDMGLNLVILPDTVDLGRYWLDGEVDGSIPAEYLDRVSDQKVANRLVPLVKRRVDLGGEPVLLTGIAEERFKGKRMEAVFGMRIDPSTAVVGGAVVRRLGLTRGAEITLLGEPFTVAETLAETGAAEDVRVYVALADAQRLLDLEGRVTEIQALECHCGEEVTDPVAHLAAALEPLLPGTTVVRRAAAADARRAQRLLADRTLAVVTPIVLALCGVIVVVLSVLNVRERRAEVGVLRAIGWASLPVAGVFLGRGAALGAVGGAVGGAAGPLLFGAFGDAVFERTRLASGTIEPLVLLGGVGGAAALAVVASFVAAALAVRQDPAEVLRDA